MRLTFTEAAAYIAIRDGLCFQDYRLLSEFLIGDIPYILPGKREYNKELGATIAYYYLSLPNAQTSNALFLPWKVWDNVATTLTPEQQRNLLKWILLKKKLT